jgi:hypothetical protein
MLRVLHAGWSVALIIGLASGVVLFGPHRFTNALRVAPIVKAHRPWFGGAFIVAVSGFAVELLNRIPRRAKRRVHAKNRAQRLADLLDTLSEDERGLLRYFLSRNRHTLEFPLKHATADGLVARGVLCKLATTRHGTDIPVAYTIEPEVWNYMRKHSSRSFARSS